MTPKRVKHRKWMRDKAKGIETRGTALVFGSYGLKAMGTTWVPARQIEAGRRAIIRYLRKGGKIWVRIFPDKPVTQKGAETPMGGGKGGVDHYVFSIRPGRIIFEVEGIKEDMAKEALGKAADKLSVKTIFIKKED